MKHVLLMRYSRKLVSCPTHLQCLVCTSVQKLRQLFGVGAKYYLKSIFINTWIIVITNSYC